MVVEYFLDDKNYITGWTMHKEKPLFLGIDLPTQEMNEELKDSFGNYKYRLDDKQVIEDLQIPSEEQIELKRINWCKDEIHKAYGFDSEMRVVNLSLKNKNDPEYVIYREKVDEILLRSHDIGSS